MSDDVLFLGFRFGTSKMTVFTADLWQKSLESPSLKTNVKQAGPPSGALALLMRCRGEWPHMASLAIANAT